jgi:hypothetical protein
VHGDREALAREEVERRRVRGGRKPASGPAMSKPTDAAVAVPHGELGDLEAAVGVPHRGDELAGADVAARRCAVLDPSSMPSCTASTPRRASGPR